VRKLGVPGFEELVMMMGAVAEGGIVAGIPMSRSLDIPQSADRSRRRASN
jgi:predicted phosphoribosyltransferase